MLGQSPSGGAIEILLLEPVAADPPRWRCLAKPGKRVRPELTVTLRDGSKAVLQRKGDTFFATFAPNGDFFAYLENVGTIPLPPYFKRDAEAADREHYQTVFAKDGGSVAAPTAGLHFTPDLIHTLGARGIAWAELTLHVGYATFAPLETLANSLHSETYAVPSTTLAQISATRAEGGRVIAVGTTSVRALETCAVKGPTGSTDILIRPGHEIRSVDALITNFHLPETSLLLLVEALLGRELLERSYATALAGEYRFYSYGDAMLIL